MVEIVNFQVCRRFSVFFLLFFTFAPALSNAASRRQALVSGRLNSLKSRLRFMKTGIDKVLTRYISSEMECTSTLACRVNPSTSLKLSILPSRADMETDDWRKVFEVNLNGLQDFNLYLHRMLSEDSERTTLSEANQDVLRQVWNTVNQFMFFFKHHMEDIFCFEINVEPFELYPPCHSCGQNIPPSRSLEIVRNYQFMMQFYNYLDGFSDLYNKFLLRANVPDRCG